MQLNSQQPAVRLAEALLVGREFGRVADLSDLVLKERSPPPSAREQLHVSAHASKVEGLLQAHRAGYVCVRRDSPWMSV